MNGGKWRGSLWHKNVEAVKVREVRGSLAASGRCSLLVQSITRRLSNEDGDKGKGVFGSGDIRVYLLIKRVTCRINIDQGCQMSATIVCRLEIGVEAIVGE